MKNPGYWNVEASLIASLEADGDFSLTEVNSASKSFAFLEDEPDLYSCKDMNVD